MPTIIDELSMTLNLDASGFKEGAQTAQTASANLLQQILATMQQIEAKTRETAASTVEIQRHAADQAQAAAEEAARKEEEARLRAERAKTESARRELAEQERLSRRAAEEHRKAAAQMEESFNRAANSIKRVAVELLALFGISMTVTAFERMFSTMNRANQEAGYLAQNLNADIEALTSFQGAVVRMGGTREGAANAAQRLMSEQQAFSTTGRSNLPAQAAELFGISIAKPGGKPGEWMSIEELTRALAAAVEQRHMDPAAVNFRLQQMGLGDLINPVMGGTAELDRQQALQRRTGDYTTERQAGVSKQFNKDLEETNSWLNGIRRLIVEHLTPAFDDILQRINRWISSNKAWIDEKLTDYLGRLSRLIMSAADAVEKWVAGGGLQRLEKSIIATTTAIYNFVTGQEVKDFISDVVAIAKAADTAAQAVGGWGNAVEILAGIWVGSKVLSMLSVMGRFGGLLGTIAAQILAVTAAIAGADWLRDKGEKGIEWLERQMSDEQRIQERKRLQERPSWVPQWLPEWLAGPQHGSTPPPAGGWGGGGGGSGGGGGRTGGGPSVPPPRNLNLGEGSVTRGAAVAGHLASDLNLSNDQAAGIVGNLQAESGLRAVQERGVTSGRGGYGWAQWTGPRRIDFENYAKQHGLDPSSDEANYGFLRQELQKPENARLLEQLRNLKGPNAAHEAAALVERLYERPRVSNAGVRGRYAEQIAAHMPASGTGTSPPPMPSLPAPSPAAVATLQGSNAARRDTWATSMPEAPLGAATAAQGFQMSTGDTDNSNTSTTHVGEVHVHTAATDAPGIAKAIKGELKRFDYVAQADTGLA